MLPPLPFDDPVMQSIAPLVIAGGIGLVKGVKSWLGQRSANKQAEEAYKERVRASQDRYARQQAQFNNVKERRQSTLNFAKAFAQSQGYGIPDSAFDFLVKGNNASAFPGYSKPLIGQYKPNSAVSGLVGGAGGFLDAYQQLAAPGLKKYKFPTDGSDL